MTRQKFAYRTYLVFAALSAGVVCVVFPATAGKAFALMLLALLGGRIVYGIFDARITKNLTAIQDLEEKINLYQAERNAKLKVLERLPREIDRLNFLRSRVGRYVKVNNTEEIYRCVCEDVNSIFPGTSCVLIYTAGRGALALEYSSKTADALQTIKHKKGDVIDVWAVKQTKEILIEDPHHDFRFDWEQVDSISERSIGAMMLAPLIIGAKTVGLLRVESSKTKNYSYDDLRLLSVLADVAALAIDRQRTFERVENLAIKDPLTGLYLRPYFTERMQDEFARASANSRPFSVIMIDIDHFKTLNDTYGHLVGDAALKRLAHQLHSYFASKNALVARFGGEEFAVLLPETQRDAAVAYAEEIRARISADSVEFRRSKIAFTVSLGVAAFPISAQYPTDVVRTADEALYAAKAAGRDRVCSR
jgi:diguanylate cyclase (GGDEF)-like protein